MPRGDRTGPWGMGPMTGRGAGFCAGYNVPGYMNPGIGRGWGRGWGFGWGRGWGGGRGRRFRGRFRWWAGAGPWFWSVPPQPYDPAVERDFLKSEADALREELVAIEKRLAELEQETSSEA